VVEHAHWRGRNYLSGIEGQKIAIVGYSHHRKPEHQDHPEFTRVVLWKVLDGTQKGDSFFATVAGYFGCSDDQTAFWNRVVFFNLIPQCIGTSENRYRVGTACQHEDGRGRFTRILKKEKPNKVFVFTTKGWRECPLTAQEKEGKRCTPLADGIENVSWGRYVFDSHTVTAFGLHHPQYANKEQMKLAVRTAMKLS
jgi:hypothetical protein